MKNAHILSLGTNTWTTYMLPGDHLTFDISPLLDFFFFVPPLYFLLIFAAWLSFRPHYQADDFRDYCFEPALSP